MTRSLHLNTDRCPPGDSGDALRPFVKSVASLSDSFYSGRKLVSRDSL